MTVPGVGPVVSLTYRATVDVPARFHKSKSVGAVFGIKMPRSLARFNGPEASNRTPSLADFITTTFGFRFSVHTGVHVPLARASLQFGLASAPTWPHRPQRIRGPNDGTGVLSRRAGALSHIRGRRQAFDELAQRLDV